MAAAAAAAAPGGWRLDCKLKVDKKKARDGKLSLAPQQGLGFAWAAGSGRPPFQLALGAITDQMTSKGTTRMWDTRCSKSARAPQQTQRGVHGPDRGGRACRRDP